jgi:hypothetical protein
MTCSGGGTHPQRVLGWLVDERDPTGGGGVALVPWVAPRELRGPDRIIQRGTLQAPCPWPTCKRTVPMRQETAARRYDALVAAGMSTLDVSHIR